MSFSSTDTTRPRALVISAVTLTSDKLIKWVELRLLANNESPIHLEEQKPQSARVTFEVPQNLSLVAGSTLRLKYSSGLMLVVKKSIKVKVEELSHANVTDGPEKQVWKRSFGKIGLEVEFVQNPGQSNAPGLSSPIIAPPPSNGKQLRPTTDEILNICPRFRILVMGKSGAGKSSLINKAFGVTDANVSDLQPGQADINYGIVSKDNPRFLLHDSQGFEHGEDDTVDTVRKFIKNRNKQDDIKEKLHAIWLCIEIPTAGGRLLEIGVENFLKLKTGNELGKVPIIVVFTKYDKLVNTERLALAKQGSDPTLEQADEKAKGRIQKECISPFEAVVGQEVPHITVSTSPEYSLTLSNLVHLTFTNVENYIADAAVVTGISQKVNASVKIRTSIEVGKRKYWRGLASSTNFPGVTLRECLEVIHFDIVKVWDLDDKHKFLQSEQFRALMSNSVDPSEKRNPNRVLQAGLPMLGAVTAIITALSGPVAPIVLPIIAGLVFAVWVHDVYQQSRTNLRRLMTYILNLTLVMQYLFWIQGILAAKIPPRSTSDPGPPSDRVTVPITRRLIKLAFNLYLASDHREYLLTEISDFSKHANLVSGGGADATVKKIIALISSSAINDEEAFKQQSSIKALNESWEHEADEAWDAQASNVDVTSRVPHTSWAPTAAGIVISDLSS